MNPWRLGNKYDRPIARRIAEEAGLPRQMFGQSKMGSVVVFPRPSIPYSNDLRAEFFKYLADAKIMGKYQTLMWPVVRWINSILMLKSEKRFTFVHYVERVISKVLLRQFTFRFMWAHLEGTLFCFSVNKTASMHREHLSTVLESSVRNASKCT
jgi:hypothetical protein